VSQLSQNLNRPIDLKKQIREQRVRFDENVSFGSFQHGGNVFASVSLRRVNVWILRECGIISLIKYSSYNINKSSQILQDESIEKDLALVMERFECLKEATSKIHIGTPASESRSWITDDEKLSSN